MKIEEMVPRYADQILSELGLQRRESPQSYILPALGVFAVGAVVGAAVALMMAPSSGRELRSDIEKKIRTATSNNHSPQPDGISPAV